MKCALTWFILTYHEYSFSLVFLNMVQIIKVIYFQRGLQDNSFVLRIGVTGNGIRFRDQQSPSTLNSAATSCRKKKSEEATFLQDVKNHIDEFINASMDEHKTCFTKTIQKMFSMSKVVAEKSSSATTEVESSLALRTD